MGFAKACPALSGLIGLLSLTGCALLPGNFTYIEYRVIQENESASLGVIDFDFTGSDTAFNENLSQRGSPYEFTIAVFMPQRFPGLTLKNVSFIQKGREILAFASKELEFISDTAVARGGNRVLYMNLDRQSIGIAHERFEVRCEVWTAEEKVSEGTFTFSVQAKVSRPNKHVDAFFGITYRREPAPPGGTGSGGDSLATVPARNQARGLERVAGTDVPATGLLGQGYRLGPWAGGGWQD